VKTAISIPDEIFEQAERLAKIRGWSRSELHANAVEPLLANAEARSCSAKR
jgi:metal-responsive CopG/Arc/MetJ family transcriptional regulator